MIIANLKIEIGRANACLISNFSDWAKFFVKYFRIDVMLDQTENVSFNI